MSQVYLEQGERYHATLKFGFFDVRKIATNEQVKEELFHMGFAKPESVGSGGTRSVAGTWTKESQVMDVPDEFQDVMKVS